MFGLGYLVLTTETFELLHPATLLPFLHICITRLWNNDSSPGVVIFHVMFYHCPNLSSQTSVSNTLFREYLTIEYLTVFKIILDQPTLPTL